MEATAFSQNPKLFRFLSVSLHIIATVHFMFGCLYFWFNVHVPAYVDPVYPAWSQKFKFFTYWNVILQTLYFGICTVVDSIWCVCPLEVLPFCKFKDFIEAAFAFPVALFVGVTFWGLMAIDRELVLPRALDPYFPTWLNHIVHTNIVIMQLLEVVTSPRTYPNRNFSIPALFVYGFIYIAWLYLVLHKTGLWVYPVLNELSQPARIGFFFGSFILLEIFYFIGEGLNKLLWARFQEREKNSKSFYRNVSDIRR